VTAEARRAKVHAVGRLLRSLGPGVTTGAADDDPSGIATYSVVGAQHGLAFLWSALFIWPLMGCVQMMCARIGMVTGMGLAGAMRQKFPRWLVGLAVLLLLLANIINIAADLAGMADAAHMLRLGPSMPFVWVFGLGISALTVWLRYHQIANILKWLALALFAYVITVCDESEAAGCPIFPGVTTRLHWSFADPSKFSGSLEQKLEQTRKVRDEIEKQIRGFCAEHRSK